MFSSFLKNVVEAVAPQHDGQRHVPAPTHGFRVLKVKEGTTGASQAIESFYDFVVAADGIRLGDDAPWLQQYLQNAQRPIILSLWSAKGGALRDVTVPPPTLTGKPLGLALRWCPTGPTTENVYHVLDVAPRSPAALAGLRPHEDYIVGTPEGIVRGESGLGELIEDHLDKSLQLYVFNAYHNTTRLVTLRPSRHWGGQGAMGCGIGFGALHRLPRPLTQGRPVSEGQTLFENPRASMEVGEGFLTGAQLSASVDPATLSPLAGDASKMAASAEVGVKAKRKPRLTSADIEAMMNEGGGEEDAPTRRDLTGPPPPAGGRKLSTTEEIKADNKPTEKEKMEEAAVVTNQNTEVVKDDADKDKSTASTKEAGKKGKKSEKKDETKDDKAASAP